MTETSPRQGSIIRRHTGKAFCHSYTGLPKGAQYTKSNWNFRFCVETRSKCSSMFISLSPKNQNTITKAKKNSTATSTTQHQAIIAETCPRRHQHITERSPKHRQIANKTTPKQHRGITKKRQRQDRGMTETSPRPDRDKTKTRPRQNRDMTETSPRHH